MKINELTECIIAAAIEVVSGSLSGRHVGLLINFNVKRLRHGM